MNNFKLSEINVKEFLEECSIRNIDEATDTEIRFSCPFPGHLSGDENPSAYMNSDTTAWFCHGCKRKGNALSFVQDLYNLNYTQAVNSLRNRWGVGFRKPEGALENEINRYFLQFGKPDQEPINYSLQLSVLSDFTTDWSDRSLPHVQYMLDRGFRTSTLNEFQIGYDKLSERITVPIFDEVGRLVGIKGRAIDPEVKPKYKVLGGSQYGYPRYHVGLVVFGIDKVPPEARTCIIAEGELNSIALHQIGWKQAIAAGGSTFTEVHAKKIIDRFEMAVLFFDSDKAGNEATNRAAKLLLPYMKVYAVPDHDLDPAEVLETYPGVFQQKEYIHGVLSDRYDTLELMV